MYSIAIWTVFHEWLNKNPIQFNYQRKAVYLTMCKKNGFSPFFDNASFQSSFSPFSNPNGTITLPNITYQKLLWKYKETPL